MRNIMLAVAAAVAVMAAAEEKNPLRVAVLDFDNQASMPQNAELVGGVAPQNLAEKGVAALGRVLAADQSFVLIDRRDFVKRMQPVRAADGGAEKAPAYQPSFLQAAQAVRADLVLRGSLLSYAPGKQIVNLGGMQTEFVVLSLRVGLEALDACDGTIVAAVDGAAKREFRQTDALKTVVGEDEMLDLLQAALAKATPELKAALQKRQAQLAARPRVKLSVKTSADPALIEIDGMLIGTTPLKDFALYAGDHVITVGKAGYRDVNKRIMLNADTALEVPLMRTQLTADELKEILEKSRLNIVSGVPEAALEIHQVDLNVNKSSAP